MTLKPCIGCGEPAEGRHCEDCRPPATALRKTSPRERGYDAAWDRLSRAARRLQPFCVDCGSEARLTADHKPSAWERKEAGLPLRLEDVEVVCNDCNVRRGSSRPGAERASTG